MAGCRTRQLRVGDSRGYTLIELMLVVAIIGLIAAIGVALYASLGHRARVARAQADVRTLGSAITTYAAHTGAIPTSAANMSAGLTTSHTVGGAAAGPFLGVVPAAPTGGSPAWPAYVYAPNIAAGGAALNGAFVVCSSGDGAFANSAGVNSCP